MNNRIYKIIPIIILLMACQRELLNPVDPELTEAQCIELGYQDECGVCDFDTTNDGFLDMCGECDSDTSNDCVQDCTGNYCGNAVIDECGVCGGDGDCDNLAVNRDICGNSGPMDCAGECGGDATIDECGNCCVDGLIYENSSTTPLIPCGTPCDCN